MKLIFLGPPGSGKGTQASMLKDKLDIPTISTGTILRGEITAGTDIGLKADAYISKGELVPDDVIMGIIEKRLLQADCKKGFILDGFPRNTAQAQALEDRGIEIDAVILLDINDQVIVNRLSGRLVCKKCDATFNLDGKLPKVENICDKCGGDLFTRSDDMPETVLNRLKSYHKSTEPLLEFYKNKLCRVGFYDHFDKTHGAIMKALNDNG